jgi:ATP-dependent Clp protease ATP-binding subunit ClpA
MFERFTEDARAVVRGAFGSARRLEHRYVGTEHLLLAVAAADGPAGEVLREQGVTAERVKDEILRQIGTGVGAGLFAGLDEKALAAVGIDLDAVRAKIQASFSSDMLYRAEQSVHTAGRRDRRPWQRPWLSPWPWRWGWRTRRPVQHPASVDAAGCYLPPGRQRLPLTPCAKKVLELALRESLARHDAHIGTEHITLALLHADDDLSPRILAALHADAAPLRAAILNRYRKAS